ncbi:MAG: hypothetical protein KF701_01760 [Anaerolineales bacterium]|nr:MAG: hypothetical protein KF701_01760 [Anaerolineales bacterium]
MDTDVNHLPQMNADMRGYATPQILTFICVYQRLSAAKRFRPIKCIAFSICVHLWITLAKMKVHR